MGSEMCIRDSITASIGLKMGKKFVAKVFCRNYTTLRDQSTKENLVFYFKHEIQKINSRLHPKIVCSQLQAKISKCLDKFCPLKQVNSINKPWLNREVKQAICKKISLIEK